LLVSDRADELVSEPTCNPLPRTKFLAKADAWFLVGRQRSEARMYSAAALRQLTACYGSHVLSLVPRDTDRHDAPSRVAGVVGYVSERNAPNH